MVGYLYAVLDPGLVQRALKLVEPIITRLSTLDSSDKSQSHSLHASRAGTLLSNNTYYLFIYLLFKFLIF
jgi:hypothetical protein